MYDAAVIGTGPAGLSAALNLKLHNKSILWFGAPSGSDKVEKSEKIANYPGLGLVSGAELNRKFREHAAAMELESVDKMVTLIAQTDEGFSLLRLLLLDHGVETADDVAFQSAHGAGTIKDEYKFSKIIFHFNTAFRFLRVVGACVHFLYG